MGRLARSLTAAILVAAFAVPGGVAAGPCAGAGAVANAAGPARRAGLVVELPGQTRTYCIAFTAEEDAKGFTGADLLERSGLRVVYGGTRSALTVCRIEDFGCLDTGRCFCDCPVATAPECRFWGYYTLGRDGRWIFSQLGASARRVRDGEVDGWRYANHYSGAGGAPAAASLTKLCAAGASTLGVVRPGSRKSAGGLALAGGVGIAFALGAFLVVRRRKRDRGEQEPAP